MKHAKPLLTVAERYSLDYGIPIETIERLIEEGHIR